MDENVKTANKITLQVMLFKVLFCGKSLTTRPHLVQVTVGTTEHCINPEVLECNSSAQKSIVSNHFQMVFYKH